MHLRSGLWKPARIKDEEDDQENFVAEDRVDRAFEANVDEEEAEGGISEGNFNSILKKREVKQNAGLKVSLHIHKEVTYMSKLPLDAPTDRWPMFDFLQDHKNGVCNFILISIIITLILQKPLYSGCNGEYSSTDCSSALDKLCEEFPQLKKFCKNINVTYKMCSKSDRPGVILVLHNGNGNVANCIVNRTASILSMSLRVHPAGEYLSVDGRTALSEYGESGFLESIMEQRQKFGVVAFLYLEQIDSGLVKNLHFICDKDPNIADKAIIILVLKVETQTFENENLEDMAKRQIKHLWGKTLGDRLQPIIGRITNIVTSIDENVITNCS